MQIRSVEFMRSDQGSRTASACINIFASFGRVDDERSATNAFADKLSDSLLYWISPDMSSLVDHALPTMPEDQVLRHEDLPAPVGIIMFEQPVEFEMNDEGETLKVKAISWLHNEGISAEDSPYGEEIPPCIHLISWATPAEAQAALDRRHGLTDHPDKEKVQGSWWFTNSIVPMGTVRWEFGQSITDFRDKDKGGPSYGYRSRFYCNVLMMMARISRSAEARTPRHQTKRAIKVGLAIPDLIRCVTLRREQVGSQEVVRENGTINWSHRIMVQGFWRNHWYPSIQDHRRIYIAPHIRGPEDKPLVIKDTVYGWTR